MHLCSPFDEALAQHGPPAVFVRDMEGQLRAEPDLSRDGWERCRSRGVVPTLDPSFALVRDRATGFVSLCFVIGFPVLEPGKTAPLKLPAVWPARISETAPASTAKGRSTPPPSSSRAQGSTGAGEFGGGVSKPA